MSGAELRPMVADRITIEHGNDSYRFGRHLTSRSQLLIQVVYRRTKKTRYFWRLLTPSWWERLPEAVREQAAAHFGLPRASVSGKESFPCE